MDFLDYIYFIFFLRYKLLKLFNLRRSGHWGVEMSTCNVIFQQRLFILDVQKLTKNILTDTGYRSGQSTGMASLNSFTTAFQKSPPQNSHFFPPVTLLLQQARWGYLVLIPISLNFEETFTSRWWEHPAPLMTTNWLSSTAMLFNLCQGWKQKLFRV